MSDEPLTCSVVMVSYHTGEVLFASLRLALAQPEIEQVILVNNGNPPEHEARLARMATQYPKLKFISGHGNIGFAAACNKGVVHATGGYVLLLNPDVLLATDAAAQMMLALQQNKQAMLAGCHIINPDATTQRACVRNLLTWRSALAEMLLLPRFLGAGTLNLHRAPLPQQVAAVPAISGACMMLRYGDYNKLGGLDEGYFLHVEDIDLCRRIADAGGQVLFVPQVKLVHMLSSSDAPSRFIERCKAQSFKYYFAKHKKNAAPFLPLLSVLIELRMLARRVWHGLRRSAWRPMTRASRAYRTLELLLSSLGMAEEGALPGRKVLVTGASSPLGMSCVGALLASGAQVIALSRSPDCAFEHGGLQWLSRDLEKPLGLSCRADALLHVAPLWLLPPQLEAIAALGVKRVVAFGSTSVFGKAQSTNAGEQGTVRKLKEAEDAMIRIASERGLAVTLLRPTLIYGGGLDRNVSRLARTIKRLRLCFICPPASGKRQPVHAQDLAFAAVRALATPQAEGRSYNLSGAETLTYRQFLERIFRALGLKPRIIPLRWLPLALDVAGRMLPMLRVNGEMAKRHNTDLCFSHDDAARDLHYAPRPFLTNPRSDLPL